MVLGEEVENRMHPSVKHLLMSTILFSAALGILQTGDLGQSSAYL